MTSLKEGLLSKGYLPENLPPAFVSMGIADYFKSNSPNSYLSRTKTPVRSAVYNASKRGMTRRVFSMVHPVTGYDLAEFTSSQWGNLARFFAECQYSLSVPKETPDGDRALAIATHSELEKVRLSRLSQYRFIAKTDISRFYHSVYTHAVPWAFHGKSAAKADRKEGSSGVFFNRVDHILRCGQDGQTIGIPVGPDASRAIAETVSTAIDLAFKRRNVDDVGILRHVDDVWIGGHSHADVERALWRYRESIREFELDINESKTRIYAEEFRFSDEWPTEVARQIEFAIDSPPRRSEERLRAALEHAFSFAVSGGDDGVLKYVIRHLDQSDLRWRHWETIEPFLKRAAVHFGHSVDYITRVIVWRHLARGDLDLTAWSTILATILDKHGRLGNDSEVCWAIYACMRLGVPIHYDVATSIIANCGALSILSLLNCVELKLVDRKIFAVARSALSLEDGCGPYWPLILEWRSRKWPKFAALNVGNEVVQDMCAKSIFVFDSDKLPPVFRDLDERSFGSVSEAIERRVSLYEDDTDEERYEEPDLPF